MTTQVKHDRQILNDRHVSPWVVWVFIGISAYSVVVMIIGWLCGVRSRHPLIISGWIHIVLALLLTLSVVICVRM